MPSSSNDPLRTRRARGGWAGLAASLAAAVAVFFTAAPSATAAPAAAATSCPAVVSAEKFASAAELKAMTAKFNSYGPRVLGSAAHNKAIAYLEDQARAIKGVRTKSDPYGIYGWYPGTRYKNGSYDIGAAGGLTVTKADGTSVSIADAGAVRFSKPTAKAGEGGPLVYLPAATDITRENAAGKVVIRDYTPGTIPFGALKSLVGLYLTSDLVEDDYIRPYIDTHEEDLIAAGQAGAAGVIFTFEVPGKQVRGYYDPHTGTIYRIPAVYVGNAEGEQLKALATQGAAVRVSVDAKLQKRTTRNVIATLPGRSAEKIVLAANTDGNSWVQEDGVIGILAFARYYAALPAKCRPRTLEMVFASSHDTTTKDGTDRYSAKQDPSKIAFAYTIEHLGTREILPTGEGNARHLAFTGIADPGLFAAGDSDAVRKAAVAATKRRHLSRTAVLKGLGVPNEKQAPLVCSMGGLGNAFHQKLIPTLAMISGPWSLYDPVFGDKAIDFARMRLQMLVAGDAILALDGLPKAQIAGDYPALKAAVADGTKKLCPGGNPPQFAPSPGA